MNRKKTILVVEDDAAIRFALTEKLTKSGFITQSARDGAEGLSSALANKPDLILMDLLMPKMDGTTTMEHLRKDKWGMQVPIIILTNFDANNTIIRKSADNQHTYNLIKAEISLDELVKKIKEVLHLSSNKLFL